jgi:hypothetical protein
MIFGERARMTRGVSLYLVGSLVLVALSGCGRGFFTAEREPWRAEAERACLKSGAVKETADLVRINPISGPGVCGAEYPLKVAAIGESSMTFGFADDLRPPAPIANQPRWPVSQPSYAPSPYPQASLRPTTYPGAQPSAPPVQPSYPSPQPQAGAPMPLNAPGVAPSDDDDEIADAEPRASQSRPSDPSYPPASSSMPPRLGPVQGSPINRFGPVALKPAATLACPIVSTLDRWLVDGVQPAAQRWFGAPVVEIKQISAYSCRGMNGNSRAHISEHAFGNALDIAAFTLADGRRISVKEGWKGMPEEQGFLRDVQAAACQLFNTVLAPGSNVYHYDHIHVDLMRRASGRIICQPAAVSGEQIAARAAPRGYAGRDPSRDLGITGAIGKSKRVYARGPLSREDRDTIEDESRIRDRD